jgi:flagellar basal body-associated protein FliL
MMNDKPQPSRAALTVYRVLLAVAFALLAALLAGTVYGLVKKALRPADIPPEESAVESAEAAAENMFSGIGTIRVSTAPDGNAPPETLIVSVVFPYDSTDRPFSEELVSRIEDFKRLTAEYLGSFTAEELQDINAINRELLSRYNALLRLGQIRELYFLDFIWL